MRYALFYLTILTSALLAGCTSPVVNSAPGSNAPTSIPAIAATASPSVALEGNCKICTFDFASYKGELKKEEIDGLLLALNDEYLATATYEQVNKDLGDPRPFVNIVQAEKRHAEMLKVLFKKYVVMIPENPWPDSVPKFESVAEACKAGVQGEIANRDLYTRLFKSTAREDILETYTYLQLASEENHLPAFERCGGARGPGGPGRRGGPR